MGFFDRLEEPVILKKESSAKEQLAALELLSQEITDPKIKSSLESEISALKAGIFGEDAILFELENSHMPMFVLHDLYLKHDGLTAQIDFLVITRKRNFLIECKNLYGNIAINQNGDFIRTFGSKKEGIYSPITQNRRHLDLLKQIRKEEQGNLVLRALFERYFYQNYRSVVVLANPKTVLTAAYAKKEVKEQVIRADQLLQYIRRVNGEADAASFNDNDMEQLANFFLSKHVACPADYTAKYRCATQQQPKANEESSPRQTADTSPALNLTEPVCPKCGAAMVRRKATRGANVGREFWGCSQFPKCRGIINL